MESRSVCYAGRNSVIPYRADIDGLRALSIVLVLIYHVFPDVLDGGFIGVDVFFVISGFLITQIILGELRNNSFNILYFYFRRIRRLFPCLILVMAASFSTGFFVLIPSDFSDLVKHIMGGLAFVANFTLWIDAGYFNVNPEKNPLLHLWSLGVEEQFYLAWPLLLVLLTIYTRRMLIPVIALLLLASFFLNVSLIKHMPDLTFYFPITRFWQIGAGAIVGAFQFDKHFRCYGEGLLGEIIPVVGLLCILVAATIINRNTWYPGWWALLPTAGAALIISADPASWLNKTVFSSRTMVWLGLISYPLYLWHWPINSYFKITGQFWLFGMEKAVIIGLSVLLAWGSYHYVDLPIRKYSIETVVRHSFACGFIIFLVSAVTFSNEGWPGRAKVPAALPPEIALLGSPDFGGYIANEWREGTCFLERGQNETDFSAQCLNDNGTEKLLFLWGDSHAAALYPGLRSLADARQFGLGQFTASTCPPVLGWNGVINPRCESINNHVLAMLEETQPDILVLQAAWYNNEYSLLELENSLRRLLETGIPNIILLGAAPSWADNVPYLIYSHYLTHGELPPQKSATLLDAQVIVNMDRQLRESAETVGVTFLSLNDIFCDENGCMLYLNDVLDVTSLDGSHLSTNASVFAAEALADSLTPP